MFVAALLSLGIISACAALPASAARRCRPPRDPGPVRTLDQVAAATLAPEALAVAGGGGCGPGDGDPGPGGGGGGPAEPPNAPPTTHIALTPATPDGNNSWYRRAVKVDISATDNGTVDQTRCVFDPGPGAADIFDVMPDQACAPSTTVSADGEHAVSAASVDTQDLEEDPPVSAVFKIDQTPPELAASLSKDSDIAIGDDVTATPNATDATSGVASQRCDNVDTTRAGRNSVTCTATDNAGNVASASLTYVVVDVTPPTTTIALQPPAPNGDNGWYRSLSIAVNATDPDDPVAATQCKVLPANAPAPASYDDLTPSCPSSVADGDAMKYYAASVDSNGNKEKPVATDAFKLDSTPPMLDPKLSTSPLLLHQTGARVDPGASDATSGIAVTGCGSIDTSTAGDHTVTCSATDNAGNTATRLIHYTVEYQILGFFPPVPGSKFKTGQTVPVKIALADANGTRISDADGTALASACRVRVSVTPNILVPQCMTYDPVGDQFQFDWKVSGAGPAMLNAIVGYPSTNVTTQTTLAIAITDR